MTRLSGRLFCIAVLGSLSCAAASAQTPSSQTLFNNVRIFDGKSATLSAPSNVLIKGNMIARISTAPIAADPATTEIAGGGRTLMPGLIDAHWHTMLVRPNPVAAMTIDGAPGKRRCQAHHQQRHGETAVDGVA